MISESDISWADRIAFLPGLCGKLRRMSRELLHRLDLWKSRFGPTGEGRLERLLTEIAGHRFREAQSLIRLHETLLFLRAYPRSAEVVRLADEILFQFADRIGDDLEPFEEPEVSGIAGTSLTAVFSYEVARRLAARYPRAVEVAWDRYDEPDRMGNVIRRFLPMLDEDFQVEAHTSELQSPCNLVCRLLLEKK